MMAWIQTEAATGHMDRGALIFMGISWAVVIVVNVFCFARVFKKR